MLIIVLTLEKSEKISKKPKPVTKQEVGSVLDLTIQSAQDVLEAAQTAEEQQISATSSTLNAVASSIGPSGDGPGKHLEDAKPESKSEDASGNMPTKLELLSDINSFISSVDWYKF